jgi:hypothetical protein
MTKTNQTKKPSNRKPSKKELLRRLHEARQMQRDQRAQNLLKWVGNSW